LDIGQKHLKVNFIQVARGGYLRFGGKSRDLGKKDTTGNINREDNQINLGNEEAQWTGSRRVVTFPEKG